MDPVQCMIAESNMVTNPVMVVTTSTRNETRAVQTGTNMITGTPETRVTMIARIVMETIMARATMVNQKTRDGHRVMKTAVASGMISEMKEGQSGWQTTMNAVIILRDNTEPQTTA